MPVQVDRAVADHPQPVDAGLLGRLAQSRRREAHVPGIAVAAELLDEEDGGTDPGDQDRAE